MYAAQQRERERERKRQKHVEDFARTLRRMVSPSYLTDILKVNLTDLPLLDAAAGAGAGPGACLADGAQSSALAVTGKEAMGSSGVCPRLSSDPQTQARVRKIWSQVTQYKGVEIAASSSFNRLTSDQHFAVFQQYLAQVVQDDRERKERAKLRDKEREEKERQRDKERETERDMIPPYTSNTAPSPNPTPAHVKSSADACGDGAHIAHVSEAVVGAESDAKKSKRKLSEEVEASASSSDEHTLEDGAAKKHKKAANASNGTRKKEKDKARERKSKRKHDSR